MQPHSAISQLYHGSYNNYESIPLSARYWELLKVFTQLDEEMRALLASQTETLAKYDKTVEAVFAQEIELSELHYAEGFRFGMLLGMEIK